MEQGAIGWLDGRLRTPNHFLFIYRLTRQPTRCFPRGDNQHGGAIDIATEPGAFTEFIITLPRTMVQPGAVEQKN